jgi:hypothetical protein
MRPGNPGKRAADLPGAPMREAPLIAGVVLLVAGAVLMRLGPDLLEMPQRREARESALARFRRGDRLGAAAQRARDGLVDLLPGNLLGGIGRALVFAGAGVLVVRLLDLLAGDDGRRRG